jgi:hypothetical protein
MMEALYLHPVAGCRTAVGEGVLRAVPTWAVAQEGVVVLA